MLNRSDSLTVLKTYIYTTQEQTIFHMETWLAPRSTSNVISLRNKIRKYFFKLSKLQGRLNTKDAVLQYINNINIFK